MMIKTLLCSSLLLVGSSAFTTVSTPSALSTKSSATTTTLFAITPSDVEDAGFYVSVKKPIGVVFGENKNPYGGLRVDEVELGTEGSRVGLRVGDQLMAINGEMVIGENFDFTMGVLKVASTKMKLLMYRGSVRDLYTILNNRGLEVGDDDGSEVIIMDENYESPVRVEVIEDKGFDFGLAMSRLVGGGKKEEASYEEEDAPAEAAYEETPPPPKKKGGGLFGMFGEAVQLEGDDASGTK